jgi:tryptophan 2,3-dioxygenase
MLNSDKAMVQNNPHLSENDKAKNLAAIEGTEKTFAALFDEKSYNQLREAGHFRLSFKALHAALFIQIYRDEPVLQQPFNLLQCLIDIDENFTMWRYRHALMALRMLGKKIGTGGSSGHQYLKDATEKHKVFSDFFALTTYFLPRSQVPDLPSELLQKLRFSHG